MPALLTTRESAETFGLRPHYRLMSDLTFILASATGRRSGRTTGTCGLSLAVELNSRHFANLTSRVPSRTSAEPQLSRTPAQLYCSTRLEFRSGDIYGYGGSEMPLVCRCHCHLIYQSCFSPRLNPISGRSHYRPTQER